MNVSLDDIYTLLAGRVTAARELQLQGGLFDELDHALTSLGRTDLLLKEAGVAFTNRKITVQGKTDLLKLTGLTTSIEITGETQRRFFWKFDLPSDWKFQNSFAALPKSYKNAEGNPGLVSLQSSILNDFTFSEAAFILQNFDDGPLSTGLNFSGVIPDPVALGYLKDLLQIAGGTTLKGPVRLKGDEAPDLRLKFGIATPQFQLDPALQVKEVTCQIRTAPAPKGEQGLQTRLELIGGFQIGKTQPITISATTPLFSASPIFSFDTQFGDGGVSISEGVNALVEFAGGTNVDFKLPDALMVDRFKLTDFSLVAETNPPLVRHIQFTVASDHDWQIVKDTFAVTGLKFGWLILFPFNQNARTISATVSGTLALSRDNDRVSFDVTARRDAGFVVTGALHEGDTIQLAKLIAVALGFTPGDLPALDVNLLRIEAGTTGDFSIEGNLKSEWKLPLGSKSLALKQVSFSFSRKGKKNKGTLSSVVEIGGAKLNVTASVPESGNGFSFQGGTFGDDQQLDLTAVGDYLFSTFGVSLPSSLPHVLVSKLTTEFNTATTAFDFVAVGSFKVHDRPVGITLNIKITKNTNGSYAGDFSGQITVGTSIFNLIFSKTSSAKVFVGAYRNTGGASMSLRSFIDNVSPDVASLVPEDLSVELKNVLFGYRKNGDGKFLFGVQLGTKISLSDLPLVGKDLPADKNVSVDGLRLLVTSAGLNAKEIGEVNELIPADISQLPTGKDAKEESSTGGEVIAKGLTISAQMNFGETSKELIMQVGGKRARRSTAEELPAASESLAASAPDNVKWFALQKTFGPVYFDKVGVQYEAATLRFLMNAALSAAGLTLSLDGLSLGSSLSKFDPKFELRGLGIDYKNDAVEIGGAFLRTVTDGKSDSYDGAAVIKTKQFAVSALGSYTTLDGEPSLFIYAFVNYPLGGPAFFFITGLAAGFGYNRRLIAPSVEQVAEFPLVKQATGTQGKPKDVMDALKSLQAFVPPNVGSIFLAVGVRFNSFKLVDSFALLTIEFGNKVAINLIGLSKAVVPTPPAKPDPKNPITPLAQVEIAWKATFNPDNGCLGIDARLTPNSYILSKDCRLSGGYAFYSWFTGPHAGDFVQTLGGYHPKFDVPAHYPKVPRLAFDWRVSNSLTIQGDAYYALTGSALMAGGHLEVLFREGELRAWLKLGADFLIAWKPYHYDASIYVNVGASYTFNINLLFTRVRVTISVDVGAQLHLWGPDFSGTAKIDLSVISFTIAFGARASQTPQPLKEWTDFQQSFLPLEKDVCTISVKDGLVRNFEDQGKECWVINPKEFSLVIDSAIPLKSAPDVAENINGLANVDFGIGPMAVDKSKFKTSTMKVTITRSGRDVAVNKNFKFTLIKKLVPAGLWGETATPSLTSKKFLEDVATAIEITPADPPTPGESKKIDVDVFKFEPEDHPNVFKWEPPSEFVPSDVEDPKGRRKKIADSIGSKRERDDLMAELKLGVKFVISIDKTVAGDFLTAPQIGTFGLCQPK